MLILIMLASDIMAFIEEKIFELFNNLIDFSQRVYLNKIF